MLTLFYFGFLVLLFVVIVIGALATLFAVGAAFYVMEYPEEVRQRIDTLFRQPVGEARTTDAGHYYQPHWKRG